MRNVKRMLACVLALSMILCSLGMISVSAIEVDDEANVILDIDFTSMEYLTDLSAIPGISVTGVADIDLAPDGTTALKLGKDAENPGSMTLNWNNGHAQGAYRIQVEEYIDAPSKELMQSPIIFSHVRDSEYNDGEGLEIAKISYDAGAADAAGIKNRVYAHVLAGIVESSADNYLTTNGNKSDQPVDKWTTFESLVDTSTGSCSALADIKPSQAQTRTFEDPNVAGNFAPNQLIITGSSNSSENICDMYISRILITGPEGEPGPIEPENPVVPVAQDFVIAPLEFSGVEGTVIDPAQALALDKVTVIKSEGVQDKEFTVLVVEYKDGVFSKLNTAKHEPTTEEVSNIDIPVNVKFSPGTTSIKVMLWDNMQTIQPLSEYVRVSGFNISE